MGWTGNGVNRCDCEIHVMSTVRGKVPGRLGAQPTRQNVAPALESTLDVLAQSITAAPFPLG